MNLSDVQQESLNNKYFICSLGRKKLLFLPQNISLSLILLLLCFHFSSWASFFVVVILRVHFVKVWLSIEKWTICKMVDDNEISFAFYQDQNPSTKNTFIAKSWMGSCFFLWVNFLISIKINYSLEAKSDKTFLWYILAYLIT